MSETQSETVLLQELALLTAQVAATKRRLECVLQQAELPDERLDKARLYNCLENTWADLHKLLTAHQ